MNEFTKEELEVIKHGVDWVFEHQEYKDKPPILELGRKIQSMIDNYCEHDSPCSAQQILDFAKGMR